MWNKITSLFCEPEPLIIKNFEEKSSSNSATFEGRYVVIMGTGNEQQMCFTTDKKFASSAEKVIQFANNHTLNKEQANILKHADYESSLTSRKTKISTNFKLIDSILEKIDTLRSKLKQMLSPERIDAKARLAEIINKNETPEPVQDKDIKEKSLAEEEPNNDNESEIQESKLNNFQDLDKAIKTKKKELMQNIEKKLEEVGLKDEVYDLATKPLDKKQDIYQIIFADESLKKAVKDILNTLETSNEYSNSPFDASSIENRAKQELVYEPPIRALLDIDMNMTRLQGILEESLEKGNLEKQPLDYQGLSKDLEKKIAESGLKDKIPKLLSLKKEIQNMEKKSESEKQIQGKKAEIEELQNSIIENETLKNELLTLLKESSIAERNSLSRQEAKAVLTFLNKNPSIQVMKGIVEKAADQLCQTSVENIKKELAKENNQKLMKEIQMIATLRTEIQKTIESCLFPEDKEERKKVGQEIEKKQIEIENIKKRLVENEESKKILLNIKKEWEISEDSSFIEERAKAKMLEDPLLKEIDGLNLKKSEKKGKKRVNFNETSNLSAEIIVPAGKDKITGKIKTKTEKIYTQIPTNLNNRSGNREGGVYIREPFDRTVKAVIDDIEDKEWEEEIE